MKGIGELMLEIVTLVYERILINPRCDCARRCVISRRLVVANNKQFFFVVSYITVASLCSSDDHPDSTRVWTRRFEIALLLLLYFQHVHSISTVDAGN